MATRARRADRSLPGVGLGLKRVLVLYWYPHEQEMRLAVRQHVHALDDGADKVVYHNAVDEPPRWLRWLGPDFVVLHTTFLGMRWNEDFDEQRDRYSWLARIDAPKIALPQDEYDHAGVLEDWLIELGAEPIFSCHNAQERAILYPRLGPRGEFHRTLTGFIDVAAAEELAARMVSHDNRPFDLVYRAAQLPYWFGSHGQLKHRIGEVVGERARALGFRTDISTRWEDVILADPWLDFMLSGRATIGCESGSSVLDRHGEVRRRVRRLLEDEPGLSFDEVDARMPSGWDSYAFFAISPRHFEAVITKTAQILVEGSYNGVLEAERHYIPLRRDFADLDEALLRLRDVEAVEAMTERAYREVYLGGRNTLRDLAAELRAAAAPRSRRVGVPLALAARLPPLLPAPVARWKSSETRWGRRLQLALTLLEELVREPAARRLLFDGARGALHVPVRGVAWDLVALQVLSRIGRAEGRIGWSLSAQNVAGTITIRTHPRGSPAEDVRGSGPIERVVWDHSAAGRSAPLHPLRPRRGRIPLGVDGRYEFAALAGAARLDTAAAQAIIDRTLGRR